MDTSRQRATLEAPALKALLDGPSPPTVFEVCWGSSRKQQLFEKEHIPGAIFVDIHALSGDDHPLGLSHVTRPATAQKMEELMNALGVSSTDEHIVCYSRLYPPDGHHAAYAVRWATRAWWTLRSWGFRNVFVLNGVYEHVWQSVAGMSTEAGPRIRKPASAKFAVSSLQDHQDIRATTDEVLAATSGRDKVCLLDTLENWPNTGEKYGRSGHLPGALSTPLTHFADSVTGRFADLSSVRGHLSERFDPRRPVIAY